MGMFIYHAIDKVGRDVKGHLSSDSLINAKDVLKAQNLMIVNIAEHQGKDQKNTFSFHNSISIEDLSLFTRQLATLLKAKIQVIEALHALVEQSENRTLKLALSNIKQKVNEGSSLAKALELYPKIFNTIYVNMIEAGESSGTLEIVLLRLAEFTESQKKLKNKIQGAMIYPCIMMAIGTVMISIIFLVVIPKITKIFISMKKELPLQTQFCIWISNTLQNYWWLILLSLLGCYYLFKRYLKTRQGRSQWDFLILKIPLIGHLIMMVNVSRFSSTLSTLLQSGVPILPSMTIVCNLLSNSHMKKAVEESQINIAGGASMVTPLLKSQLFPPMMIHMITLGERSGEMTPMLNIIAETYQEQIDAKLTGLTAALEPIMMVVMGVIVGFIIFSVIVPLMSLNK